MYVITVIFRIKPEHVQEFLPAVGQQARNSVALEAGCRQFDVCVSPSDETQVFLYEIYDDEDAFNAHLDSDHYRQFDATVSEWVAEKVVNALHRVAAG